MYEKNVCRQNRRTKWKKQDGISNTEAADYKVGGDKRPKDQSISHKTKVNKSMKNNKNGNSSGKHSGAHNLANVESVGQTSSCSQTSDETVKNMSHNSNSSDCNSSVKNDVTDATTTASNKLNANYDIDFKFEIDENDSTSPRSLRIADQEVDTDADRESSICYDDDEDDEEEAVDREDSLYLENPMIPIDYSVNKENSPSVSSAEENKSLDGESNRVVYRMETCDEKTVNGITKTFVSDSHSLLSQKPQIICNKQIKPEFKSKALP
jgi:hypothetical protein